LDEAGSANHDGVAAGLFDHADGVFGRQDVAVTDDRNFHGGFDRGDAGPVGFAGIALFAGARVEGDGLEAAILGHAGHFDHYEFFIIPARPELAGERDRDGFADSPQDRFDERQIAQQAGAAVAFHDFVHGTAEVDVENIEAQVFTDFSGRGHGFGVGAEQLGGNRVFFRGRKRGNASGSDSAFWTDRLAGKR